MGFIITDSDNYSAIASAIRSKAFVATTYAPSEMASAIMNLPTGGGQIKWGELRPDAELEGSWTYDKMISADEGVTIPVYSTSVKTLKSATTIDSLILDLSKYSYFLSQIVVGIPIYNSSQKGSGRFEYSISTRSFEYQIYPANTFLSVDGTLGYSSLIPYTSSPSAVSNLIYCTSDSTLGRTASIQYGCYGNLSEPSITNAGNINILSPSLVIRGHSSYLSSTYWDMLTDIRYYYDIELWKVPLSADIKGWTVLSAMFHALKDIIEIGKQ